MFQTLPDSLEPRSIVHSSGRPTASYPKLTVSMKLPSFVGRYFRFPPTPFSSCSYAIVFLEHQT
ncbi:hypothetical protein T02_2164 [Trichinella nativa]|uniref:Uncharacterized protein n=1 Tax=Trichinella nativa TaxID=6335 RepID=A0A0V1LES7_9BILA|nr:hypothetical protein T02_2164 [Trichinella nativa]